LLIKEVEEFVNLALPSIGEQPTMMAIFEGAKEVAKRLEKTPKATRTRLQLVCDVLVPGAVATLGTLQARRATTGIRGAAIRAAIVSVGVGCTIDRIRRAGGPGRAGKIAKELVEAGVGEVIQFLFPFEGPRQTIEQLLSIEEDE